MKMRWIIAPAFAVAIAGCGGKKHLTADEYFNQATDNFRAGALTVSIEQYHDLLDQYPFSQYNEEAELRIAHAQYLAGNYPEAIVALTDFQRRHPTSPHLPFVGYSLGMCYVQQMTTIDRDQTAAQNAQTYFVTVSQQYPESPFAELAREQLAHCRENLGQHELYVAKFYDRRGNSKATEIRLLTLASRYGETDASADGLLRLARLYRSEKLPDQAALAYHALAQLHPKSPQAATARRALEKLSTPGPAAGDPLDLLLAANGRQRSSAIFETVQVPVPGLEPRSARAPAGYGGGAAVPQMDPFGRGHSGRPY